MPLPRCPAARPTLRTIARLADDLTLGHAPSAAVVWQNVIGGAERVAPLVFDDAEPSGLKQWFERERPHAIIASGPVEARAIAGRLNLRVPGPVGFATINRSGTSRFAGMEERPEEIGAAAVRLLASLVQQGDKGIPAVSTVTMVKGQWIDGTSVRSNARRQPVLILVRACPKFLTSLLSANKVK